jgi:D-tyrosyl-tRNA(Tyr) deacylase
MIAIVQRCASSSVSIDNKIISKIPIGLLVLLGIFKNDEEKDIEYIAKKIISLRIFNDRNGKMNLSLKDIKGSILVVSQFTLCANLKKGSRPSFIEAAPYEKGETLYKDLVSYLKNDGVKVQTGKFGANMDVKLVNQGPATFVIDSNV